MKRKLLAAAAAAAISLLIITPVMAAYYVEIDVTESNGTDYDQLAMNGTLDVDYLADHEFIDPDGLDTRLRNSAGGAVPFMLHDDYIYFSSSLEGDKVTTFTLTTGNTPLSNFDVIPGHGGYVTISDHANLELGDTFELVIDGYVDTGTSGDLLTKTCAIDITSDGAGNVDVQVWQESEVTQTTQDTWIYLYSGNPYRAGQRFDDFPATYITSASFYLYKSGDPPPTGTGYVRVRRVSDDEIIGTLGSISFSEIGTSPAWYDFDTTPVYNPTVQDVRICWEGAGPEQARRINFGRANGDLCDGMFCYYEGSWTDFSTQEATFKYKYYTPDGVSVTAATSAAEQEVTIEGDGTDLLIYVDDVEKDSTPWAGASVPDFGEDWILGSDVLPYYTYSHETSGTPRISYAPDSIISGTTLPNEMSPGTYDGVITWGDNPTGVSVDVSSLLIDESYVFTEISPGDQDIIDSEPATLVGRYNPDLLSRNPLNPLVQTIEDTTDLPASLIWTGGAYILLFVICVAVLLISKENIMFTVLAGLGWSTYCYLITVFDLWIVLLFCFGAIAAIVHERMPNW